MPTKITPAELGRRHLDRIVEISWQDQWRSKEYRTAIRGRLVNITHDHYGATVIVDIGQTEITVDIDRHDGEIELTDD